MDSSSEERPVPGSSNQVVVYGMLFPDGHPSLSPFCLKLETYLMLAKIPYKRSTEFEKSSKGKVPWISYDGEQIADSQFCIEYLNKKFRVDLNQDLSTEQKAIAHAFRIMLDEFQFWCNVYFRFYSVDDPWFIKFFPSAELREGVMARYAVTMPAQGIGRHSEAEILKMFAANLQVLEDYLGDKPFLMGEKPTEVDCSVYGFVGVLIYYTPQQIEKQLGQDYFKKRLPKLYEYFLRMKDLTYPDFKI